MTALSRIRVTELVRKEFRQMFRDPRMKPIIFVSPVVQLLLLGYAVNTDVRNTSTFVVDHDRSVQSARLVDAFTSTGYFTIVGGSQRPADLVDALEHGTAVVGIEIPAGFSAHLSERRGAHVQVLVDGTNSNTATIAQGYAVRIVQDFGRQTATLATGGGAGLPIDLRARAWSNPEL